MATDLRRRSFSQWRLPAVPDRLIDAALVVVMAAAITITVATEPGSRRPVTELDQFTGDGWEQEDDITLLTLQRPRHS